MIIAGMILFLLALFIVFTAIAIDSNRKGGPKGPWSKSGAPFVVLTAIVIITGAALLVIGINTESKQYDQETVRLCTNQHGVVQKTLTDGKEVCVVDGSAVQFEPGIWTR